MTNANEKMNFLISNAKANVNLAAVCFQLIKSAPVDERPKLLEDFFVGYKSTPTTGELKLPITISDEEERKYMIRYGANYLEKMGGVASDLTRKKTHR